MKKIFHLLVLVVPILVSCRKTPDSSAGGEENSGLELSFPRIEGISPVISGKAIVNGKALQVFMKDGKAYVDAVPSENGIYEVIWPASSYSRLAGSFVAGPGQAVSDDGLASWGNFPCAGKASSNEPLVALEPLMAVARVHISGGSAIRSLHLEDLSGGTLAATYRYKDGSLMLDADAPQVVSTTLIAAPEGSENRVLALSVPQGRYESLLVRATDIRGRCAESLQSSVSFTAGQCTDLGELDFRRSEAVLYAQHFDSCVWGGDPLGGHCGYGPDNGLTAVAGQMRRADEAALFPKNADIPGTGLFRTEVWDNRRWALSDAYLHQTGIGSFDEAFYACAYQGYIGGNPALGYSNRPVFYLPVDMDIDYPRSCELSFRICAGANFSSEIELMAVRAQLIGMELDGSPIDVSLVAGNENVTQKAAFTYVTALLRPDVLSDGLWHEVKMRFNAFSRNAGVRIFPSSIRGVDNVFYIDDIVVRDCSGTAAWPKPLPPMTTSGSASELPSSLRLVPSYASSVANGDFYTVWPKMGLTWVSGSIPMDESQWEEKMAKAMQLYEAAEPKPKFWSIHLPYGNRGTERNRDLCVPDEALHKKTVEFFKRAILAVAPLKPANVLVHCNQTLLFNDGSSADMMVRSLKELAPIADGIGAHLVVENMSYGVGADAAVLADCVDRANEGLNLQHDIRICMDTGHANLYLNTVGDKGNIVDWLKTAGKRVGDLHIAANRGLPNKVYESSIVCYDDHLFPGYDSALTGLYDKVARSGLWGEFYKTLLVDCLYRGPFIFECSTKTFDSDGETRSDHAVTPWQVISCHENYIYPEYRKVLGL